MRLKKRNKPFIGIRRQLVIRIVALVVFILLMFWILNTLLMAYLYRQEKVESMENVYDQLNEASLSGALYDSRYDAKFEQISYNNNLDIVISTYDGSILLSSGKEKHNTIKRLQNAILSNKDGAKSIVHTDVYDITLDEDEYVNDNFLILTGTLSDGNLVMIRYAMENMKVALGVVDRTLIIIGLLALVLAFLLTEFIARRLTQPIVELTNISKKMSELDFDVKYRTRDSRTEIDILGEHMNTMSSSLENALDELQEANKELKKDIEIKEKNEEMRKEFLSNVSHELKTPIALIQGYAEGLSEGMADDPESRAYYCEVIVDESQKMNKMVQQLLSLNELEYGVNSVEVTEFNISELIRSLVNASKILIENAGIKLSFEMGEDVIVNSDEYLVEVVFSNFLSNAIHYCKNENVIKVSQVDRGDTVLISVYNSGDTILEEDIERLWDKFYKIDKARTRAYGGSGVGLSIVKAALETLNGKYGVYNLDNGVTFWFEIYK
ncbi:MAG: HAMP domain-containing protein [Lachnospiraceae bacterium]|nr:HAMP domain-containing protein [Lachnospiraceae bacterium]